MERTWHDPPYPASSQGVHQAAVCTALGNDGSVCSLVWSLSSDGVPCSPSVRAMPPSSPELKAELKESIGKNLPASAAGEVLVSVRCFCAQELSIPLNMTVS